MDIKDIRSFMECYEARSINKAAKALFITPQGLGKILDRLEHELQIKLFDRTKQGLVPTEAGVFFYEKGLKLLAENQELEQGLESLRKKNDIFNVGYSCGLIRMLPMKKIEQFQGAIGKTELVLEEGSNPDIKQKLVDGQLEVALVIGRVAATGFIEREIDSKSMCAVVPKGHKFFGLESLKIMDLRGEHLISLNEKYQSYANLISSCEREGFYPDIRIKTMEAAMIYEFVREGHGIGIDVDIHNKDMIAKDIKLIPIVDGIPWNVYLVHSNEKNNDKSIQQFLDVLCS